MTSHREIARINLVIQVCLITAKMSGEFHSRRDLHPMKLKQRPQILIQLSFTELCDSKLSGLHPLDNMAISL